MKLLICVIFYILGGFSLEYKLKKRVIKRVMQKDSKVYYWCIALMMISALNYGTIVQYGLRILNICFSGYIIMSKLISGKKKLKKLSCTFLFGVYFGFCTISSIYSVDIFETVFKCIELWEDFIIIWLLFSSDNYEKVISNIFEVIISVLVNLEIISLVGFIILPSEFSNNETKSVLGLQLSGGILSANALGALGMIIIILLLNSKYQNKYKLIILSFITIFLAQARTALIIMGCILLVQSLCTKRKGRYLILSICIVIVLLNNFEFIKVYFLRGAAESNISGMSGRKYMWDIAKQYINNKPLLGYGFGASGIIVSSIINMSSLHSGYYETLMGIGYIGLMLLLCLYVYSGILLIKNIFFKGFYNNSIELMLFIFFSIRSYTSLGIANWHSYEMTIWIILVFSINTFKFHGGIINCINKFIMKGEKKID